MVDWLKDNWQWLVLFYFLAKIWENLVAIKLNNERQLRHLYEQMSRVRGSVDAQFKGLWMYELAYSVEQAIRASRMEASPSQGATLAGDTTNSPGDLSPASTDSPSEPESGRDAATRDA
jgi:hypothetical protein